jgi:hypothetical protein
MRPSPSHEELQEMLPAAALDALAPPDLDVVLTHAGDCEECARLLDEYRSVTGELALLLPREEMDPARSAALRSRLLARARGDAEAMSGPGEKEIGRLPAVGGLLTARWTGWAVAAGLSGVLLMHHAVHRPLHYGWLVAGALVITVVGLAIYAAAQRRHVAELERVVRGEQESRTRNR